MEFYIGLFVIVGIACIAYLVFTVGEAGFFKNEKYVVSIYENILY